MTMYAWPRVPPLRQLRAGGIRPAWQSNVLRPRVAATTVLPAAARPRRAAPGRHRLPCSPRTRRSPAGCPTGSTSPSCGSPPAPRRTGRRATFDAEKPVIVFAGRAESVRGVDTLIEAFPRVLDHVPGATLRLLLIPRPELAALVDRVAAAGDLRSRDRRHRPGARTCSPSSPTPRSGPGRSSSTTRPPRRRWRSPRRLSVGLPVVATDVGCVRAVVEPDVNGLTVPPGDPDALATALLRLLTDRDHWQRLAAAGPATTRHLGWSRAAEVTATAYRTALGPLNGVAVPGGARPVPPTTRASEHGHRAQDRRAQQAPRRVRDLRVPRTDLDGRRTGQGGDRWPGSVGCPSGRPLLRDDHPARFTGRDRPRRRRGPGQPAAAVAGPGLRRARPAPIGQHGLGAPPLVPVALHRRIEVRDPRGRTHPPDRPAGDAVQVHGRRAQHRHDAGLAGHPVVPRRTPLEPPPRTARPSGASSGPERVGARRGRRSDRRRPSAGTWSRSAARGARRRR